MANATARITVVGAACALACGLTAAAPASRRPIEYRRDPRGASRPAELPVPPAPDLPPEIAPPAEPSPAPRAAASRRADPRVVGRDPAGLGTRAADEMAAEAVHVWAYRQYWRAGFARGLEAAFADPRVGRFDRQDGFRQGRLDPAALDYGRTLAEDAAANDAARAADDRVAAQFADLSRVPRIDPRPVAAPFAPAGPFAADPALDDVFASMPWSSSRVLSRDAHDALSGWTVAPAALARGGRSLRVYDPGWRDAAFAFTVWRDRQRQGSYWSRFGPHDRDAFRAAFLDRFPRALAAIDARRATDGFRIGWVDGWRYGAATREEWEYRQGYARGFDAAVARAASEAYPAVFERAYDGAYAAAFDAWSREPHPGIAAARVEDGDGDGIFEPGERVLVDVEPVNFGGGSGTFELRAAGERIEDAAFATVRFSGRGRTVLGRPLAVRVAPDTPVRTATAVTVTLGEARVDVPFLVSRPLEIAGPPRIDAERLAGRVRLVATVANRSRRAVAATARLAPVGIPGAPQADDLGTIPAGGTAEASFDVDGLDPLDLVDGSARWDVAVGRSGADDDRIEASVAPVVADPADPTLLAVMRDLAARPHPQLARVRRARALALERLRADWVRACSADGNPFKRDYRSDGAETALGALARAAAASKRGAASRDVFGGLGDEIAALADALPGAHPLLRKWMKKLAKRVG